MSTYQESYCNTTTDLQAVEPNIDGYDSKREVSGWAVTGTADVYVCHDCGHIEKLYRDGADLGEAEISVADVESGSDGAWYYDTDDDACYIYSTADPATYHRIEGGRKWSDVKADAVSRASAFVRSYVGKPIIKRTGTGAQSESLRDYDDFVIQATAALACSYLVNPYDVERANVLRREAYSPGNKGSLTYVPGLLDMVQSGQLPLWNESSKITMDGQVTIVSQDTTSTGTLADVEGTPDVHYDRIKVVIEAGGTVTQGEESTVTYSAYVGGSTGLKTVQVVDAETVSGLYQQIGHGMSARFTPGVYVAGDEWQVEVRGDTVEAGPGRRSIRIRRV